MGKKLTTPQLRTICSVARDIRDDSGSRKKTVTVYNMKWTDAIKNASKLVLKNDEQGARINRVSKRRAGKK